MKKMKPEIKKLWVKALRSGKYKQCRGFLRKRSGFCCLGVLCDLHSKQQTHFPYSWEASDENNRTKKYGNEVLSLPPNVVRWAGLKNADPCINSVHLSHMNDKQRLNFKKIADVIEANL